ncbi:hypothetical protein FGB62_10g111 [Gracilaria domingensis]|nr:hypothetical protein FGB62_10g111 [Gracilaria domingensis]
MDHGARGAGEKADRRSGSARVAAGAADRHVAELAADGAVAHRAGGAVRHAVGPAVAAPRVAARGAHAPLARHG